jgi:1,4-dihydroxy-2-naphthoate polyprenyltransferase
LLATAILVANNLRDIETDARVGKRTLAVILGLHKTRRLYGIVTWGGIVVVIFLVATRLAPPETLVTIAAAPEVVQLNRMARHQEGAGLLPLLSGSARLHLIFGVLIAAGLFAARLVR